MTDEEVLEVVYAVLDAPSDSECLAAFDQLYEFLRTHRQQFTYLVGALHDDLLAHAGRGEGEPSMKDDGLPKRPA